MRILVGHAGLRKCSDDTAGGCPCGGADRGRGQPTGCNNGSEAGDRKQAEVGEKSGSTTDAGANAGACAGAFRAIITPSRSRSTFLSVLNQLSELLATMLMSECGTPAVWSRRTAC